jgi:serine phosphatase RsbU (regulator of sigma subunit)
MAAFSETDEVRAEVQEQLRYNQARGVTLFGFWLLVFVLRVLWRLPVATEILLGLGLWIGANVLYAVGLRHCASISDVHSLALGYLVLELLLLTFCVHFLGGVEWVSVLFYGLIVGDASLVLPTRRIYLVVTLAVLLFGSLAFAEYGGLIPHRSFFLPELTLHQDLTWVMLTVLVAAGALAYMSYVFSRLTSALRERKEALRVAYMQKARELELARSVQARLLRAPPAIPGLDIAAINLPASECSGDFFCFMDAGEGRHLLAVGDVAGHGVPAALTMSATMMAIELSLQSFNTNGHGANGSAILSGLAREVDQFLTRRIGGESFVTAFFALYDEKNASLVTLDLGHSHVLAYLAASGKAVLPRWAGERQLPLMAAQHLPSRANGNEPRPWPLRVEPGDALVLYTDGLVEARNGREEYGIRRLRQKVAELGARPAVEIAQSIIDSVTNFTGGGVQKDDVTLVVVKRTAGNGSPDVLGLSGVAVQKTGLRVP